MVRRTKVLLVVTKSNFGGAQRYVFDLATNLPTKRFEVLVAAGTEGGRTQGLLAKRLGAAKVPLIELTFLERDFHPLRDLRAFFRMVGLFLSEKPDCVHLNSSKAAGLGALAARLAGIPRIIVTIHGLPADEDRTWFLRSMIAFLTWLTALCAHRVIAITDDAALRLRKLPFLSRKVALIYNGIQPATYLSRDEARNELRKMDSTIPDGFLLGSIGELHHNKGFDRTIDALRSNDMHLVIIGDGEERASLAERARTQGVSTRVHFLGYVHDAARYVRAFDAFILPSRKEGLPYVLLEAGAAGVPVIASDLPTLRSLIIPNETGLTFSTPTEGLQSAIERIRNDEFAHSLATAMHERVATTFSFSRMLEKTIALYES